MSNTASNVAKAREHYETRADRRPKQRFRKKTNDWVKVKPRASRAKAKSE